MLEAGALERIEDVEQHRPAGQRVEHLREPGAHARPLAGGQDDGRGR
jgi:hypothetical protein